MIQGPSFVMVHVPDVKQARDFYTDTLGMMVADEQPGFVQFTSSAGATYALGQEEAGHEQVELWWFVENADAAHQQLAAQGVEIVSPPTDQPFGRALAIRAVGGNTMYLLQPPER